MTWTHDRDGTLSDAFGVQSVPHMLIFDKTGRLAAVRRGYSEESSAGTIEILNRLMEQPDPGPAPAPVQADPADGEVLAPADQV